MRYFLFLVALIMATNMGCSSFKSKDEKNSGGGGAQGDTDDQTGNRVDPFNTGAKGNQAGEDDDDDANLQQSIELTANGQADVLTVDGLTPVTVAWTAAGYDECTLEGSNTKGLTGSVNMGVVGSDVTYSLACKAGDETTKKTVEVKVEPADFDGPEVEIAAKRRGEPDTAYVTGEITVDYETNIDIRVGSHKNGDTAIYSCFLQPLATSIKNEEVVVVPVNNVTQTTIYSFQCEGVNSVINTATLKVIVNPAPALSGWIKVNDVADKVSVDLNDSVAVTWDSTNASDCTVSRRDSDEILSDGPTQGSVAYTVAGSAILDLSCRASGGRSFETSIAIHISGQVEGQANLTARVKGTGDYVEGPLVINHGDDVEVKWTSCVGPNDDECVADASVDCKVITPFHGQFPPMGTENSSQGTAELSDVTISQSLLLSCLVPTGVAHDFLTVQVGQGSTPSATIIANGKAQPTDPNEIYTVNVNYGDNVAIDWTSNNATSCTLIPLGFSGLEGHVVVNNFTLTTMMSIVCTGPGGIASDSVVIRVPAGPDNGGECKTESCWNKEVAEACASTNLARKTLSLTLKNPESCDFGNNGNLGAFIGNAYLRLRAAEQADIALSGIPAGSALCGADIQLADLPNTNTKSRLFYNDQLFQLVSGAVVSTSIQDFTANLTREAGLYAFDKASIIGDQGYNVDGRGNYPHYCAEADPLIVGSANVDASACEAPQFNINEGANLGAFSQKISRNLAIKLSTFKIVKEGKDAPFTYSLGAFGDQNDFDCTVGSDYDADKDIRLEITVDYAPLD